MNAIDAISPPALITSAELAARRDDPTLKIVDARFKMPGVVPTAGADYLVAHVPGAVFFDIDAIAADDTNLPHMLPAPEQFSAAVGRLGIGNDDWVVLYDAAGIAGAARVWWMFRVFGHRRLSILDRGFKGWTSAGYGGEAGQVPPPAKLYQAGFEPRLVRDSDQVLANIETAHEQILDARSAGRFAGIDPEPWPARRSGHIPGSFNLDHTTLIDPETGSMRPPASLAPLFAAAGIDLAAPVVTSCGSGVTACVLAFALHLLGRDAAVFDGSWAEWGLPGHLPIETGPAKIS